MKGEHMKRILCVLLILCLLPACAFSVSNLETMVIQHNLYNLLTGAAEITGAPTKLGTTKNGIVYQYIVNGVKVGFFVDDDIVKGVYCKATEEYCGELLSQSASILYNICGTETSSYWYPSLLNQFLIARAGTNYKTEERPYIRNVCMFTMTKEDGVYTFLAAIL